MIKDVIIRIRFIEDIEGCPETLGEVVRICNGKSACGDRLERHSADSLSVCFCLNGSHVPLQNCMLLIPKTKEVRRVGLWFRLTSLFSITWRREWDSNRSCFSGIS